MNRTLHLCCRQLAVAIVLAAGLWGIASPSHADSCFGDLNRNNRVDVGDAVQIITYVLGFAAPTPEAVSRGDVAPLQRDGSFGNGRLEIEDVVRVLRRSVGLEPEPWPHRRVIVTFRASASGTQVASAVGAVRPSVPGAVFTDLQVSQTSPTVYTAVLPQGVSLLQAKARVVAAISSATDSDLVERVEADHVTRLSRGPNDPRLGEQWYIPKIDLLGAWDHAIGSPDVVVAIVDTGVDAGHEDLGRLVAVRDFVGDDKAPHPHGTHVAGIAAAQTDNGVGIAGVGWAVGLIDARVLDSTGSGWSSVTADALRWLADWAQQNTTKRVIANMSFRAHDPSVDEQEAVRYAASRGVVLVAAAGNDSSTAPKFPAAYPECISVAATTQSDTLAEFSNRGDWVDVAAPGVSMTSTLPGNRYEPWDGTSMASPVVAALAGLVLSTNPKLTPDQVRELIVQGSDVLSGEPEWPAFRRANARRTLELTPPPANALPNPPALVSPANGTLWGLATVQLRWQDGGDPDRGPNPACEFEVEVLGQPPSGRLPNQMWDWNPPAAGTYSWHVRAWDGAAYSPWSHTWQFTVSQPTVTLSVSSNPISDVPIQISPSDKNGQGGGSTSFSRTYDRGAQVVLTAPSSVTLRGREYAFEKWEVNGIAQAGAVAVVPLDGNTNVVAHFVERQNLPPGRPTLSSPANGSTGLVGPAVRLVWRDGGDPDDGPNAYRETEIEVDGAAVGQHIRGTEWLWQPARPGTHTWRVRAWDGAAFGPWSESWQFAVSNVAPNPPVPTAPPDGATIPANTPVTLAWQDDGDPDDGPNTPRQYQIEVSFQTGTASVPQGRLVAPSWTWTPPGDGTYTWRVRAWDGADWSQWSSALRFVVGTTPPVESLILGLGPANATYTLKQHGGGLSDPDALATSFPLEDAASIARVQFPVRITKARLDALRVDLYADSGGTVGSLLGSSDPIPAGLIPSTDGSPPYPGLDTWVSFSFPAPVRLVGGRRYWVALTATGGLDSSAYYLVGAAGPPIGEASYSSAYQTAGQWRQLGVGATFIFRLYGAL